MRYHAYIQMALQEALRNIMDAEGTLIYRIAEAVRPLHKLNEADFTTKHWHVMQRLRTDVRKAQRGELSEAEAAKFVSDLRGVTEEVSYDFDRYQFRSDRLDDFGEFFKRNPSSVESSALISQLEKCKDLLYSVEMKGYSEAMLQIRPENGRLGKIINELGFAAGDLVEAAEKDKHSIREPFNELIRMHEEVLFATRLVV